jgi:hypothetical protein
MSNSAFCQVPQVDVNWGYNGFLKSPYGYSSFNDFDILPDGRIVCILADQMGGGDTNKIICYTSNGIIDNNFINYNYVNGITYRGYYPKQIIYYQNFIYCFVTFQIDSTSLEQLMITKLNTNGSLVSEFGQNGNLLIDNYYPLQTINQINGCIKNNEITLLSYENTYQPNVTRLIARKFDINGNKILSFGNNGIAEVPTNNNSNEFICRNFIIDGADIILVGESEGNYFVGKLNSNGNFDSSFGINGSFNIDVGSLYDMPYDIFKIGSNYYMVGESGDNALLQCASVTDAGAANTTFNNYGAVYSFDASFQAPNSIDKYASAQQNDGKFIVLGRDDTFDYYVLKMYRILQDGTKDLSFGNNGSIILDFGEDFIFVHGSIKLWQDKIYVAASSSELVEPGVSGETAILRLNNDYTNNIKADLVNKLNLYPNPTNDIITLKLNDQISTANINVYNVCGQDVTPVYNLKKDEITLDISHLANGIYYLKALINNKSYSDKILKN